MDIRTTRLIEVFEKSGLTQSELCEKTKISKGALSSYLSGHYFPKQKTLEKLADALNTTVYYLMGFDYNDTSSSETAVPKEAILIARKIGSVDKEKQEQVLRIINSTIDNVLQMLDDEKGKGE